MKTFNLQRSLEISLLHQLFLQLGGSIFINENESILKIDNEIAKGCIHQFILNNGIYYFNYNIIFYTDVVIKHISKNKMTYDFLYSMESSFYHSFGSEGEKREVEKFRTAIFCNGKHLDSVLYFAENKKQILSLLIVGEGYSEKEEVFFMQNLLHTFKLTNPNTSFAYIGSFNLKIADKIQQMKDVSHKGIVRMLLIEAHIITILGLQIQQHADDLKNRHVNLGSLSRKEMAIIQELSSFIKKYPENEYSILSICLESGLSKTKLQEGFKLMHELTVTQYIRDVRILAAEHLIKTTDLNISEIVYSIGLTSRSYFSKIFKKKYKCSPKNYQENKQLSTILFLE